MAAKGDGVVVWGGAALLFGVVQLYDHVVYKFDQWVGFPEALETGNRSKAVELMPRSAAGVRRVLDAPQAPAWKANVLSDFCRCRRKSDTWFNVHGYDREFMVLDALTASKESMRVLPHFLQITQFYVKPHVGAATLATRIDDAVLRETVDASANQSKYDYTSRVVPAMLSLALFVRPGGRPQGGVVRHGKGLGHAGHAPFGRPVEGPTGVLPAVRHLA